MPSARPLLFIVLAVATAAAQDPPQRSFKSDTWAVVVDVVVRDKNGNPVTDLVVSAFEVQQDGVPRPLGR